MGSDQIVFGLLQTLSKDSNASVRAAAATALGQIGSEKAVNALLQALSDLDADVRIAAASALGQIGSSPTLDNLREYQRKQTLNYIEKLITDLQTQHKYYSHKIRQEAAIQNKTNKQTMSDQPKYSFPNAQQIQIIEQNQGQIVGMQQQQNLTPEVQSTISDLQTLLTQLQTQHPQVNTESEALAIIDAEFTEIQQSKTHKLATLRKQLLNPERHLQATKATLGEIAKHYLEESVWAKAILTYLDKLSEEPNHGD